MFIPLLWGIAKFGEPMEKRPIQIPTLTDEELTSLIPTNMTYPGLSQLFGHFSSGYVRYIAAAMDSYTWFRYVEAESKSYILKRLATQHLYQMMGKQSQESLTAGNENGFLIDKRASGFTSRGVNYKAVNEDGIGIFDREDELVLVACDGVGDCLVGEVASLVVLEEFRKNPGKKAQEILADSCAVLNQLAEDLTQEIPEFITFPNEISQAAVTALRIANNRCEISQVGDVIVYLVRDGNLSMIDPHGEWLNLQQLTNLFANEKYLAHRHIITNAIGRNYDGSWNPWVFELKENDTLILASDGLETLHPKNVVPLVVNANDPVQQLEEIYANVIKANLAWQTPGAPVYTKPDNISVILYHHR